MQTVPYTPEPPRAPLPSKDKAIIAMLGFFLVMAYTIELYFILCHKDLAARAGTEFFARCFQIYSAGDMNYFSPVSNLALALETLNVFCTQLANVWLIFAIVRRSPYRHALQLTVSSYLSYSVILYFWEAHVSGYAAMPHKDAWGYFIFYAPNLPWLLAHLYMGYDSIRTINERFRTSPARS